jgi:hypothetical protein
MIRDIRGESLMNLVQLLLNRGVQDELDFTSAQKADLRATLGAIRQKVTGEVEKALGILTQEHHKRFKEIRTQTQGLLAFGDAEVQSQLQLTDTQRGQIRAILRAGFQEANPIRESLAALQKKTLERAIAVLTGEQRAQWEQIRGQPFVVRQEAAPPCAKAGRA